MVPSPDGSVNFHNPAVVHALWMATRLLAADHRQLEAWMALYRAGALSGSSSHWGSK
jgi:hypothetical protein